MHLSAIYIERNSRSNKAKIINFGGIYFYSLLKDGTITRTKNEKFIPKFYSVDNIQLVSAIVGKNGSGKTTLLNIIAESVNKKYGYTYAILIFENKINTYINKNELGIKTDFKTRILRQNINSIYYSPFIDFKQSWSGIDISYDKIVANDLSYINEIHKSSKSIDPVNHLKMRNWIRQLEFLNSEFSQSFLEMFGIISNDFNRITFTRYLIEVTSDNKIYFHNTPFNFREILQIIFDKTRKEAEIINKERPKGFNLVNLQKQLLKNYFLMDFICLFIRKMEVQNVLLEEGFIRDGEASFIKRNNKKSALDSFINFLQTHYYKFKDGNIQLLPVLETIELIKTVYSFIDKSEANNEYDNRYFHWDAKAIHLNKNDSIELLTLQNNFINKVNDYYFSKSENIADVFSNNDYKIKDFINFEPSNRNLSSGENALLNLFSRFNEIFMKDFSKIKPLLSNHFYFILLDEADLGFHPEWKKKFISYILYFFEEYLKQYKIKAQIIFTTHDPLTLSDILNYNITYFTDNIDQIPLDEKNKPKKSFGANISDLLADSFFVNDGLIGDFASKKINESINWLKDKENNENSSYHKLLIKNIDEPIIQRKLAEMYSEKMNDAFYKEQLQKEIELLTKKLNQL